MYSRMVLMVVWWRYRMLFDANGCVSTLMKVNSIKWMYFGVNEFYVGVNIYFLVINSKRWNTRSSYQKWNAAWSECFSTEKWNAKPCTYTNTGKVNVREDKQSILWFKLTTCVYMLNNTSVEVERLQSSGVLLIKQFMEILLFMGIFLSIQGMCASGVSVYNSLTGITPFAVYYQKIYYH